MPLTPTERHRIKVDNERLKLRAALLNSSAGSVLAVGCVGPIVTQSLGIGSHSISGLWLTIVSAFAVFLAGLLSFAASETLEGLQDDTL